MPGQLERPRVPVDRDWSIHAPGQRGGSTSFVIEQKESRSLYFLNRPFDGFDFMVLRQAGDRNISGPFFTGG